MNREIAEAGDLITFDKNILALVIENQGELDVVLLADKKEGLFNIPNDYKIKLLKGNYGIYAKKKEWEISRFLGDF